MAIFTAIGAAIFGAGTFLAGLTAAGLEIAAGIAINMIAKAISGQNSADPTQFGVQGTLQAGGDIERSFVFGFGGTAGSLVYANTWGESNKTPNAYLTQVICVSDLPVAGANGTGLKQLFVNGELCTINWAATPTAQGYPVTEYNKDGADHLWVKFYDGTQAAADTFLTGTVASADRPYASTRIGTGCAYVILTSLVNDGLFNGFPTFRFGLQGAPLYDISKDSTAGGSGTQRWADPSTWGGDGDDLPAVQMYNLLRGIYYHGVTDQWLYGLQGTAAARLPNAHWVAQIAKCRTPLTGPSGSEATYRSGGEVGVNATIADTATTLLTTCQGHLAEIGGVYKLHVGEPDAAAWSFDDGTILSTEEQTFTPFFGLADTVNGITAKYPDPDAAWNTTVAPPLFNSDYEAADGNRRLLSDVALDFVPYAGQVQRLMKSALLEARRARRHTLVLPPDYWGVEPGDVMSFTSTRNGYDAKTFRVDGVVDKANLDVIVDLTEVDSSDYDWNQATDFTTPVVGTIVAARPSAQPVHGFSASGIAVKDSGGANRKATISLTWDAQPDVIAVLWQVRLASDASAVAAGQIDDVAAAAGALPPGPYIGNETYEIRIKYQPGGSRETTWSDWISVTTPSVVIDIDDLSITLAKLNQDLQNVLGIVTGQGGIAAQLDEVRQRIADQAAANLTDQTTAKTRTDLLAAQTARSAAAVITESRVRADEDAALATQITEVAASVDEVSADGFLRFDSTVDGGGASVTITAKAKASAGLTYSEAAWVLKAEADGAGGSNAYFGVLGTLYVFSPDGSSRVTGMEFDPTTGTITGMSLNLGGKIIMDGATGLFRVST